jgi:hypothetical protein
MSPIASPGGARVEEEVVLSVVAREDDEIEVLVAVVSEAKDEMDEVVVEVETYEALVEVMDCVEEAGGVVEEVET